MNALLERLNLNAKVKRWADSENADERVRRGTHRVAPKRRIVLDACERLSHKTSLPCEPMEFSVVTERARRVLVVREAGFPVAMFRGFDCGMDIAAKLADRWIEGADAERKMVAKGLNLNTETRYLLGCIMRLSEPSIEVRAHV